MVVALLAVALGAGLGTVAVVLPAPEASAQTVQGFHAMVDLDGRGSLHIEDRVAVDFYLANDPIHVVCQQPGPSYGGSSIWDYTLDGYWVPDAYVHTGFSGYHPDVPRCTDTGHATEFPRSELGAEGPFSAMVALDGRTRPVINDPQATVDAYLGGDTIYIKCQEYGPSYGGSTIWDYTTDGYWVPDAYVYTGHSGFHPSTSRCLPLGLSNPGQSHGPYYAKVALDGRDRLSADANRIPDVYLSGDPIEIVCQERGPYYAGSDIWDYTSLGYWVPDVYVYTGSVTFVSGIPRCSDSPQTSQHIDGFFRGGFGPYPAKYDLNGRHSPRADDWGPEDVDVYLAGDPIYIQCQDYGEVVAGSNLWIYTTDGYWIPDVYVYTGTSSFLPHVDPCSEIGIAGFQAPEGGHGPYLAKAPLDGRSSISPEVVAVVDLYLAGQHIYLKCQDLGVQKYGSSIWGYTTDGYWVPDHYVKTGTDGFVSGVPRCSSIGISGGDGVPTVPNQNAGAVRENIVAAARGQVGVVEGANNCNPYGFCAAWCTMFATWTWSQAGVHVVGSRVIGASPWYFSGSLYQWALGNDRVRAFGNARPGDIVIYGDSPGRTYHTGVIEHVYSDGDIATIEGNLNNMVRRVSRFNPHLSSAHHPAGYHILAIVAPVKDELTPPTDKPGNLTGSAQSANSVTLTWQASTDASNYYIERKDLGGSGGYVRLSTSVVDATSYTATGLSPGRWYRFRVVAANGTLAGATSSPYEVRTRGNSDYTTYYALGDSYSAGDGTFQLGIPYLDDCNRTYAAWPRQISSSYAPDPHHLACTASRLPDLRDQLQSVPAGPSARTLITITVGGNDMGWGSELKNCFEGGSCTDREGVITQRIHNLDDDLRGFYEDVRQRVPGADILVVGYPHLAPRPEPADDASCVGITKDESDMIYRLGTRLNNVIQSAAADAGVTSAIDEVYDEFVGREPCSSGLHDYINALVCCDIDNWPPFSGESFHPKVTGHEAYAEAVETRLGSLFATGANRPVPWAS
jgi:lysophospholipase L1-like esterase